ncbi:MAG: PspC domain-containing protein [Clostridia bacterium]|nr:PspC domain-containing protein [Clostridia bacterium]
MKKLYRSKNNRWFTGLCGGLGEYFGIDPIIIRIVAALLEFSILGLIAYFIVSYYVPEQPDDENEPVKAEFENIENN